MTVDERRIYDLVVRRFLAVLYPPFEYEQTALTVKAGNECFTARGEIVKASYLGGSVYFCPKCQPL